MHISIKELSFRIYTIVFKFLMDESFNFRAVFNIAFIDHQKWQSDTSRRTKLL